MPTDIHELKRLFNRAVRTAFYQEEGWREALLGKPTGPAAWDFDPPGPSGWKYVRLLSGDGTTIARALNTAGVADTGDLEIFVGYNLEGQLEIKRERREGYT